MGWGSVALGFRSLSAIAVCSAAAGSGPAFAQAPSPSDTTKPVPESPDKVVVKGATPEVVTLIDRQVYDVRNDPQYHSGTARDVLGKLPAVTVTPDGRILLLGGLSANILIDGKQPLNPDAAKNLPASEIDRIEVMTNPSAQFAAQGAGGIINIITKRSHGAGLQGDLVASADSFGGARLSMSPTWTFGKWSLGGSLGYDRRVGEMESERELQRFDGAAPVSTFESRQDNSRGDNFSGKARLAYKPSDDRTFSFTLDGDDGEGVQNSRRRITSSDPAAAAYTEGDNLQNRLRHITGSLDYEWTGASENESLTASASVDRFDGGSERNFRDDYDDPARADGGFRTISRYRDQDTTLKIDLQRPLAAKQVLSTGASWIREARDDFEEIENPAGDPLAPPDLQHPIRGHRDILAAYATFQFPMGKWTLLPGLRVEAERLVVETQRDADRSSTGVFPSLHINRQLSRDLKLLLSYTERTDRPDIYNLDPTIVYQGSTQASVGNPDLQPMKLRNYEGKLDYKLSKQTLNLTVYDRHADGNWAAFINVTDSGVRQRTIVNNGSRVARGAQMSMRGPIGSRWRYTITGDFYDQESNQLDQGELRRRSLFRYGGSAKIEYRRRNAAGEDVDQIELTTSYFGPSASLQGRTSSFWSTDLTWRRAIAKDVSLVLTVSNLFSASDVATRYAGDGFLEENRSMTQEPRVELSLTRKLGSPPPPAG